jgi:hypothetical protein
MDVESVVDTVLLGLVARWAVKRKPNPNLGIGNIRDVEPYVDMTWDELVNQTIRKFDGNTVHEFTFREIAEEVVDILVEAEIIGPKELQW